MTFTLIMATLGRRDEVALFLESLAAQTHRDFELIIVDQNTDDRLVPLAAEYAHRFPLTHIRSTRPGLSRNRNLGLAHLASSYAGGTPECIIAFPDDDCEYEPDTLEQADAFFAAHPAYSFCTCNTREKSGAHAILDADSGDADITPYNVMSTGISFTIFIRASALADFRFDEHMGVGAFFGSAEESDMLLFLLHRGCRGRYQGGRYVYHPAKAENLGKAYNYGLGFGALYKKAIFVYGFWQLLPIFLARLAKGLLNVIFKGNKKERAAQLRGRVEGFIRYS